MILCSDKLKLKKLKKTPQLVDLKDLFFFFFFNLICLSISYKATITQCILTITLIILK